MSEPRNDASHPTPAVPDAGEEFTWAILEAINQDACNVAFRQGIEDTAPYGIRAVRDALGLTPTPDVSDEALDWDDVLLTALCDYDDWEKAEQGFGPLDIGWTNPGSDHIAMWIKEFGAPAVRQALASSSAAIVVPDWVTHVEIEFQGPDPTWPSGTRWHEGTGATVEEAVAAAIADAAKNGGGR